MHVYKSDSVSPEFWSIRLPIIPTVVGDMPRSNAQPQDWVIDTGATGEAFAWRHHF
jgi:hypothetical protein